MYEGVVPAKAWRRGAYRASLLSLAPVETFRQNTCHYECTRYDTTTKCLLGGAPTASRCYYIQQQ